MAYLISSNLVMEWVQFLYNTFIALHLNNSSNKFKRFEHVQVIRCDIKRRNLEMFKMSQFQEKS
jgi:hypothetical protein